MPFEVTSTPPSPEKELKINGLTLLFVDYYRLARGSVRDPQRSHPIVSQHDYLSMFDVGADDAARHRLYQCTDWLPIAPVQLDQASIVSGPARLLFRILDDAFVVAITVVGVDLTHAAGANFPALNPARALVTSDVLRLIRELNDAGGGAFATLREVRNRTLDGVFGAGNVTALGEMRTRKNVGIQIWSIANDNIPKPVDGQFVTSTFGWELSALLECTSDLIHRKPDAWRRRRHVPVEALINQGAEILGASSLRHSSSLLTHGFVCMEISQVTYPMVEIRSAGRLAAYGFDSSSLYLWTVIAAQEAVLIAFTDELSERVQELHELIERETTDEAAVRRGLQNLLRMRAALYRSLNTLFALTSRLREPRHMLFMRGSAAAWNLESMRHEIDQRLSALTDVASKFLGLLQ